MANFLERLPQRAFGQQWAVSFGLGFFTWFLIICFARLLPAPLQLLTMLIPIVCFSYALYVIPKWQVEGRRKDLVTSLVEREGSHKLMRQYQLNLASIDLDYQQNLEAIGEVYGKTDLQEPLYGVTPHAHLPANEQANYLLRVQQEVFQACGDIGWALVEYTSGKGIQHCDNEGWISVEKLRSNWGRNFGLNTEQLKQLLIALTNIQIGEWRDSSLREWRLLLSQ